MDFLPIFLKMTGRAGLVVGGGEVAARKVRILLEAGADVTVVAPRLCETVQRLLDERRIRHIAAEFSPEQLDSFELVIAATDDPAVNQRVSGAAGASHLPVNVVDQPELCSFIMPSIIDRSPVVVAVSTGGASPVLARLLRARLETLIPGGYGRLAKLVERYRRKAGDKLATINQRRMFWERILQGKIPELVFSGRDQQAEESLRQAVENLDASLSDSTGEVYLVGAGPGDPDLLTFRALRLMQQADVVLYDRLISPAILSLVRRDADRIFVGKEKANHVVPQEEINRQLVRLAREGKRVLRLKGGDPFIFGRGGEEIEDLCSEGIPFQVVPGITAAAGCAAYSGIPLTHRDYSQSCVFVTGHLKDGTINLNWKMICQPRQTVVIYMGLTGLDIISREMMAHGTPGDMPAALVEQGTTDHHKVHIGTVASLPEIVQREEVHAPTLIIVGEVVKLRDTLNWFRPEKQRDPDAAAAKTSDR
ncbi:MAG: siroheme synthase CysG [Pseudomonadota bacterium]|nr:siroheme synthase CysG [Pseudomonadota bacterium]